MTLSSCPVCAPHLSHGATFAVQPLSPVLRPQHLLLASFLRLLFMQLAWESPLLLPPHSIGLKIPYTFGPLTYRSLMPLPHLAPWASMSTWSLWLVFVVSPSLPFFKLKPNLQFFFPLHFDSNWINSRSCNPRLFSNTRSSKSLHLLSKPCQK